MRANLGMCLWPRTYTAVSAGCLVWWAVCQGGALDGHTVADLGIMKKEIYIYLYGLVRNSGEGGGLQNGWREGGGEASEVLPLQKKGGGGEFQPC